MSRIIRLKHSSSLSNTLQQHVCKLPCFIRSLHVKLRLYATFLNAVMAHSIHVENVG
jgi:hypothetical protein